MKLRTQLTLAFVLLAVVPLAGIVLYSYSSSIAAFRRGVELESRTMADRIADRMEAVHSDLEDLLEDLAGLPLPLLVRRGEEASVASADDLGQVYSQLVEGIGEASAYVEWFEFSPAVGSDQGSDSDQNSDSEAILIFPSEALAKALRKLERYRGVDPTLSDEVLQSMAPILDETIRSRGSLSDGELQALEDGAAWARRLLGADFRTAVMADEELLGHLRVQVRPTPILRRVLSRTTRDEGEIPFAIDPTGALYVADPKDRELLADLEVREEVEGAPTLVPEPGASWIVVENRDTKAGLAFGIARPISQSLTQMRQTAVRNFAIGVSLLTLALAGVLWISRRLSHKLHVLTVGAERLGRGDWQVRVPEGRDDELGQLARTFNRMALELSVNEQRLLEEERRRKEQEIQQRLLQLENERKSLELEEARRFQMSLLPRSLPRVPGLEIGVHMQTATEVGGDYYDFFLSGNGSLVAAVGDATGHGSRAGTMASVVKGMLSLGTDADLPTFLGRANAAVCGMGLERMSMSLTLASIVDGRVRIAAAGMPPALLYRAETETVEEILLEGSPLGGLSRFHYHQWESELGPGDTLLLMSDGFPELMDGAGQLLGYGRARSHFEAAARLAPEAIISHLAAAAAKWNGGLPPSDDMTFVVFQEGVRP